MPRHNNHRMGAKAVPNPVCTTRQKGHSRRGSGVGTYSKLRKRTDADRYSRPYLTGEYREWRAFGGRK